MRMPKSRFIIRFLSLNFFFLALPLFIATTLSLRQFYLKTVADGQAELMQIANLRTILLSEWQPERLPTPKALVYFMKLGQGKPDYDVWSKQLQELVKDYPAYFYFIISPQPEVENQHVIWASSLPSTIDRYFRNFYEAKEVLERGRDVLIRYFNQDSEGRSKARPYLMAFLVFHDEEKKPAGILVQATDMISVLDEVLSNTYFASLNFAILNDEQIVMAASDHKFEGNYFSDIPINLKQQIMISRDLGTINLADEPISMSHMDKEGLFEFFWRGQKQIAYRATIPYMDMSILVYTEKAQFLHKALEQYIPLYLLYLAILILAVVVVMILGQSIARPFLKLSRLMEQVSRGNLNVKFVPQKMGYEMNLLGEIFNTTLLELENIISKAEEEHVKRVKYQRELDLGREVQKTLFPPIFPQIKGLELAGCYIPSENVNSDFYLIEKHPQGILIVLADVHGRLSPENCAKMPRHSQPIGYTAALSPINILGGMGIYASLHALALRSLFRTYATIITDLGALVTQVNKDFCQESHLPSNRLEKGHLASEEKTAAVHEQQIAAKSFIGLFDPNTRLFHYISCGHLPGILKRFNGDIVQFEAIDSQLGEDPKTQFETKSVQLQPNDFLFLYSDGLTEALNDQKIPLGIEGLEKIIREKSFKTAEEAVEAINQLWEEHTGEKTPLDEILILTCKIQP